MSLKLRSDCLNFPKGHVKPIVVVDLPEPRKPVPVSSLQGLVYPILSEPCRSVCWPLNRQTKQALQICWPRQKNWMM